MEHFYDTFMVHLHHFQRLKAPDPKPIKNIVIAWKRAVSTVFRNSPLVFHRRNKVRQVLKMSKDEQGYFHSCVNLYTNGSISQLLLFPTGSFLLLLFSQYGHECVQSNVCFSTVISCFLPVPMVLQKPRVNPITPITHLHGFSSTRCAPATIWTCSSRLSSALMSSPCPWSTTSSLRQLHALVDFSLRK